MSEQDLPVLSRFSLAGRVALVTGASSGLGAGFAVALAQAGADVVLAARRADKLADISRQVRELGRAALAVETDVTDPDACQAAADAAIERFGHLDALINNAGLGTAVPALRETPEQFREVIEVNLLGAYWMAQAAARVMAPGSSIVNVASVLALMKSYNPQAAYSASKAGLVGLTRGLAVELAPTVLVNAVAPGPVDTPMMDHELSMADDPEAAREETIRRVPLLRVAGPDEVARAILFLITDAGYTTGSVLPIDGGVTALSRLSGDVA